MPSNDPTHDLIKRASRLTWQARIMLFWERYAPVFLWAGLFVGLFLIGSFAGIWERIGDPWRGIFLIIALYFLVRAFLRAQKLKWPSRSEAKRRVETDSAIRHRPLDTIEDRPAISEDAWPVHYEKARTAAAKLKSARLRPVLAPLDPYFIRFALPVAIGLALMVGAGDNFERLQRALTPTWQAGISSADATFEVWANPPEYTGRPPVYFKDKQTLEIPAGSKLVARISGVKNPTRLKISTSKRSRYLPLERLGPESFETSTIISEKSLARWRIGNSEKSWTLLARKDRPPIVQVNDAPTADKRDRLSLTYYFEDDYGVEELFLSASLLSEDPEQAARFERIDIPLAGQSVRKADFVTTALDLTKHAWAGKKVKARLYARDGAGQTGGSEEIFFTIPDKIFVEPLAKAVVEHRGLVLAAKDEEYAPLPRYSRKEWAKKPWFDTFETDRRLGRAPAKIQRAALLIDAVTDQPEDIFRDPAVYMGLKNVLGRLRYAKSAEALSGIPEDLWSIAIRAEFGILGTALEEMREAEQALRDAMARRAPQREIDTLFDRYNEAVDRYVEELRRKAMEEGNIAQAQGGGGDGQNIDEIQALLDAIEEANRLGDTEGARRALAQLAELLENMQIQLAAGGGGGGGEPMPGEMSEEMKKSLEELADLLGEQRELQDETQQAENEALREQMENNGMPSGQGRPSGSPSEGEQDSPGAGALSPEELAKRQQSLEETLEALREALPGEDGDPFPEFDENGTENGAGSEENEEGEPGAGNPDEALDEAARAMQDSERALSEGDFDASQEAQSNAVEALRRAGQAMAEQATDGQNDTAQNAQGEEDPLGRENGGINDENAQADIDTRDNSTRSREILEELRRRAAEQERERSEREYLERLLKRF